MINELSKERIEANIDGDAVKAKEMLIDVVKRHNSISKEINAIKSTLLIKQGEQASLVGAVSYIINHMEYSVPLAIPIPEGIIVISASGISIETNVI